MNVLILIVVFSSIDYLEIAGNKSVFIIAVSTIMQVSITLFVFSVDMWYPGYAVIIISTSILLTVCILGTLIEVKFDQFSAALYDVPWYLMPVKYQRNFLYVLLASQMKKPITFWEYAEVTVELFLDVCIHTNL